MRPRVHGPASRLAGHYPDLDALTEGAGPVIEAFNTARTIGPACVDEGGWRFVAVLPDDDARPLVAAGPALPADSAQVPRHQRPRGGM